MRKLILYFMIVSLMILIFFFSNQPATDSSKQSGKVVNTIIDILESVSNKKFSANQRQDIGDKISFPIRKMAHFTLYFTLSILFFLLLSEYKIITSKVVLMSILLCLLYAITDEIHQLFVIGRSCEIKDVIIDTMGAVLGVTICMKILRLKCNFVEGSNTYEKCEK